MNTPTYTPLQWEVEYDDDNNSVWTAASFCHEDGAAFFYRLSQRLRDDKIVWIDKSDAELGNDDAEWDSLKEAKAALEESNHDLWNMALDEGAIVPNPDAVS